MADEKKKTGLTEKIGLFIDKALTFGGGLDYSNAQIKNAINASLLPQGKPVVW